MDSDLFSKNYSTKNNLDQLKKRLKKGMKIKGKIIDCPKKNRYILRVWGYNVYTDSHKQFEKFEEINLIVKEIEPNLIFDMKKIETHEYNIYHNTNIII